MNNLANSYADAGRTRRPSSSAKKRCSSGKPSSAPTTPTRLMSMNNLANSYAAAGRTQEALKLREETLQLRKAKLGPDHPDTLRSMNNLANSYADVGRTQEALKLREETLQLRKAKLGPDHPDTLMSMSNLANSYAALHRHADASKLHEERLTLAKARYGSDHPATLAAMNGLAEFLATSSDVSFRDPVRAVELATKTAESSAEKSGQMADYRGTLGIARYRSGDWSGARADLEKAIGMRQPDDLGNAPTASSSPWPTGSSERRTRPANGSTRRQRGWRKASRTTPT